jgi:hypothetical protein
MIWKDVSYYKHIRNLELWNVECLGLTLSTEFEDAEKTTWTSESLKYFYVEAVLRNVREDAGTIYTPITMAFINMPEIR